MKAKHTFLISSNGSLKTHVWILWYKLCDENGGITGPFEGYPWNILPVLILMGKDFSGVKIHYLIIASPTKAPKLKVD